MKKIITPLCIILLAVFISACDSKQKKQFIRGCASDGFVDKSVCSCAYDKLNDDAIKMFGENWGENPSIMNDERFYYALQKAVLQCE